jgi:hypothetical protein
VRSASVLGKVLVWQGRRADCSARKILVSAWDSIGDRLEAPSGRTRQPARGGHYQPAAGVRLRGQAPLHPQRPRTAWGFDGDCMEHRWRDCSGEQRCKQGPCVAQRVARPCLERGGRRGGGGGGGLEGRWREEGGGGPIGAHSTQHRDRERAIYIPYSLLFKV